MTETNDMTSELNTQKSLFDEITTGKRHGPRRVMVYGLEGIGKSTFASMAPNPIFLPTEDGLGDIDCASFPVFKQYSTFVEALGQIYTEQHEYKTAVIDTLDWLEQIVWQHTCEKYGQKSIEDFGYGKGYILALGCWSDVLAGLDVLRNDRNMGVILLAHSKIERFDSPETSSYDRYTPRLHKLAAGLVQQWCDEVLFGCYKVFVKTLKEGSRERSLAVGASERILRTVERPSFMAKNRLGLPEEIPLDWREYASHLNGSSIVTKKEA